MQNIKHHGFTLLELLITITIIGVIAGIAYPRYNYHIAKTRRMQAEVALGDIAARLEQFYSISNSYQHATLDVLQVNKYAADNCYMLNIDAATDQEYRISAAPLNSQATIDHACGTLTLDQMGEKGISGTGSRELCWK